MGIEDDEKKRGLYSKYYISKANGNSIDEAAEYFALRVDSDIHARRALKAYADSVRTENPSLAFDIGVLLSKFNTENNGL